jgi:phosphate transport system substrate-binding protein
VPKIARPAEWRRGLLTPVVPVLLLGAWLGPALTAHAGQWPAPATLVFAGSGATLAITRRLADAFERRHPGIEITVPSSIGSRGGIRAAADGAIALGLVTRPLEDREQGLGLAVVPFGRTPLVIGAHASVAEDGITSEELVSIYRGTKVRWRDGREIVVLSRQPDESLLLELYRKVPGFREAYADSQRARRWVTLFTDQEMNQTLARTPGAIGVTDLGTLTAEKLSIKTLRLDGVAPTPENLRRGTYALSLTLSFVFAPHRLPSAARTFLNFVGSGEGQRILRAHAYVVAK